MGWKATGLAAANRLLNAVNVHAMPLHQFREMKTNYKGPLWTPPALPASALSYLDWSNPRLEDLHARYSGHPAASHTQWNAETLRATIDLRNFRGDNHYVYQTRWNPSPATYYVTAYYARETDRLGLFGKLTEDGLFGAYTLPFDNEYIISRDLLDSVNQANVIARLFGLTSLDSLKLLDIGAGYGRLAHRICSGFPTARVTSTDAVPLSTFISEFHTQFRHLQNADVVPLNDTEEVLPTRTFDLITNFHSFSECKISAIDWWLGLIDKIDCGKMLIIPNAADKFMSTETDGTHQDFSHLFTNHGWTVAHSEPIYALSETAQRAALYPNFRFYLLERR